MVKIRAPNGWVIIIWKDKLKKKWVNTIPKNHVSDMACRIHNTDGIVIKVIDNKGKIIYRGKGR